MKLSDLPERAVPWCPHCGKPPFRYDSMYDMRLLIEQSERNPSDGFDDEKDDFRLHQVAKWCVRLFNKAAEQHCRNEEERDFVLASVAKELDEALLCKARTGMLLKRTLLKKK